MDDMENSSVNVSESSTHVAESASTSSAPLQSNSTPSDAPSNQAPSEKMIAQSEVDRIVGAVKAKERERFQSQTEKAYQSQPQAEHQPAAPQGAQYSADDIAKKVDEALQARQLAEESKQAYATAERMIGELSQRVTEGSKKYEDFNEKASLVDLGSNPELLQAVHAVDNSADVLYKLGQNPQLYMDVVRGLKDPGTYAAAQARVKEIAQTIENNQQAKSIHNTRRLPSEIKSSPLSTGNGRASYSDMVNSKDFGW